MAVGKERLRILLIGSGGREHALAWKLSQSPHVDAIYVVPGNGGTARGLRKVVNVNQVKPDNYPGLVSFAKEHEVNLVIPGPEAPLVDGIKSFFRAVGIRCFGPTRAAARMEGAKTFAKDFMIRHNIPTATYRSFSDYEAAKNFLEEVPYKVVIKASGLAGGKGVILPSSTGETQIALKNIMKDKEFGSAGDEVVIEEYLEGEELSFLTFCDGHIIKSLPPAQDHKQVFNNDKGPNTGGMGCYAPTAIATQDLIDEVHRTIIQPTVDGMRKEGFPFVGLLFTGLMITKDGPKTLEYNVRFGDPETQTLLPLLSNETDLAEVMIACTEGWLDGVSITTNSGFSACVVAAAGGYPNAYKRGHVITCQNIPSETLIFHAGTTLESDVLTSTGGRVIAATSTAATLETAISQAYSTMSSIHFPEMHYRTDIGHRALNRKEVSPSLSSPCNGKSLTYASAGVSISAGNDLVQRIKPLVASTARPGADAFLGGFGGDFDLSQAGYVGGPTLVGGMDGVGTKLTIAHAMNKHDTVGIDLVAMNVNDLVVQGAEPLFFMDCYSCGKLDVDVAAEFVKGAATGCKEAGCALIGGETAEMPGLLSKNGRVYDVSGAAVGAIAHGRTRLPEKLSMKKSDVLLGLSSSGCHSNGFSLVRKIIEKASLSYHDPAPWEISGTSVGESLLTPTRIYVKSVLDVANKNLVKGMAHITGGGLIENIPRMLPEHLAAELDVATWQVPMVLKWLKRTGELEDGEFARVFNTGLGMVIVVAEENVTQVLTEMEAAGEVVYVVGKLVQREREACVLKGLDAWL